MLNNYSVVTGCDLVGYSAFMRNLSDGRHLYYVTDGNGKYGAVDDDGNILIPLEYDAYEDQGDPTSSLILLKRNGAWEFFDLNTLTGYSPPEPIPVESVTLNTDSLTLTERGKPDTLTATVTPGNADDAKNITWQTSDAAVATVTNGVVTPVGAGTATITATCGGKSATCTVTVEPYDAIISTPDDSEIKGEVVIKGETGILDELLEQLHLVIGKLLGQDKDNIEARLAHFLGDGRSLVCAYDIHFENADGDEHEFTDSPSPVSVHMTLEDDAKALLATMDLSIYHVPETGDPEKMASWHPADGSIAFETNHFSDFVLVAEPRPQVADPGDTTDPGTTTPGGPTNPGTTNPPVGSNGGGASGGTSGSDSNSLSGHPGASSGNAMTSQASQNGTSVSGDPKALAQTSDDKAIPLLPFSVSAVLAFISLLCFIGHRRRCRS